MILYACTIFASAFLLFLVQPIMAKQILPWFGGTAAVWTTCLVFFQFVLLFGYAYSDWTTRKLSPRHQAWLHIALLAVSLATLPIVPDATWKPQGNEDPAARIIGLLLMTIGLPYFLLSTTGPLVQAWFARVHASEKVYRLFALSNFASLLALIGYPFLIEPWITTRIQSYVWSGAYALFAVLCSASALAALRAQPGSAATQVPGTGDAATEPGSAPRVLDYVVWLVLSGLGSYMLLAVSNHITQNVASVPFLWLLPLTLYLVTFILCFEGRGWYQRRYFLGPAAIVAVAMAWGLYADGAIMEITEAVPLYCVGLFVLCMFYHGELSRMKPSPRYLTGFYLMLSLGGALGGMLVGVVVPKVFNSYYELGIGLVVSAAVAGYLLWNLPRWIAGLLLAAAAAGLGAWLPRLLASHVEFVGETVPALGHWSWAVALAPVAIVLIALLWRYPKGIALASFGVAGMCGYYTWEYMHYLSRDAKVMTRNFYGTLRVKDTLPESSELAMRRLMHGVIMHGEQFLHPSRRMDVTTYYGPSSGVGIAIDYFRRQGPVRVGVIGLGTGTIAGWGRKGDTFRFYELDPEVLKVAKEKFFYLGGTEAAIEVAIGDARLNLEREAPQQLDVLAIDAFSSDSIPVHLITREALDVYLRHVKPGGVLAFHVTNRFLRLSPVVESLAAGRGLKAILIDDNPPDRANTALASTDWVLVTKNDTFAKAEAIASRAEEIEKIPGLRVWTDDYNNLFQILK